MERHQMTLKQRRQLGRHLDEPFTADVQRALDALAVLDDDERERVCATAMGPARLRTWGKRERRVTKYQRMPADDHVSHWLDEGFHYHVSEPYHVDGKAIVEMAGLVSRGGGECGHRRHRLLVQSRTDVACCLHAREVTAMAKITLDLTVGEWSELVNALASKAAYVKRGDYAGLGDAGYMAKWVRELHAAYDKVAAVLEAHHIDY